jgi:hypothetical protein
MKTILKTRFLTGKTFLGQLMSVQVLKMVVYRGDSYDISETIHVSVLFVAFHYSWAQHFATALTGCEAGLSKD